MYGIDRTNANYFYNDVGNTINSFSPDVSEQIGADNILIESTVQIITAKKT